ncbi:MAG: hypothetical protein COT90_00915 [Candidatus Diapherotrites archaeon CG10_big_fil_rev_8_21_14_0_10_31_34]|nr:MAG: hypothetical protein COT90_00915 [Candidatus Diapherotrites archaeon CG10_big_fil_rev_8_21_14_0_10_31_34]
MLCLCFFSKTFYFFKSELNYNPLIERFFKPKPFYSESNFHYYSLSVEKKRVQKLLGIKTEKNDF